jgi:hypothetical protein
MALGRVTVFACASAPADRTMATQRHRRFGFGKLDRGRLCPLYPLRRTHAAAGSAGHRLLIAGLTQGAQIIHLAHRAFTARP